MVVEVRFLVLGLFLPDAFDVGCDGDDTFVTVVTVVVIVDEAFSAGGVIIGEIEPPPLLEPDEDVVVREEAGRQSVRTSQFVQSKLIT